MNPFMRCLLVSVLAASPQVAMSAAGDAPPGGIEQLTAWLHSAPRLTLVAAFFIAPLFGVPLSALLVTLSIIFPLPASIALTALTLLGHHALIYGLSKTRVSLWLQAQLSKRRLLPKNRADKRFTDNVFFILTATWVPGLSYIFKVALTAVAGLPLRTYYVVGTLSQLLAALPFLVLGRVAEQGKLVWATLLIFGFIILAWLVRHFVIKRRKTLQTATQPAEE